MPDRWWKVPLTHLDSFPLPPSLGHHHSLRCHAFTSLLSFPSSISKKKKNPLHLFKSEPAIFFSCFPTETFNIQSPTETLGGEVGGGGVGGWYGPLPECVFTVIKRPKWKRLNKWVQEKLSWFLSTFSGWNLSALLLNNAGSPPPATDSNQPRLATHAGLHALLCPQSATSHLSLRTKC